MESILLEQIGTMGFPIVAFFFMGREIKGIVIELKKSIDQQSKLLTILTTRMGVQTNE